MLFGFELGCLPDESNFYRFLSVTKNSILREIFYKKIQVHIDKGIINLDNLIIDSKLVMAATKENNFKNPNRNSKDKTKIATRDIWANLCYYSCQVNNGKKGNILFFWGYRTHVIVIRQGICRAKKVLSNNIANADITQTLLKELKMRYNSKKVPP